MDIIITTQNVINDIGSKFLLELQPTDPIPPKGTLVQCLNEANARLSAIMGRYAEPSFQDSADDSLAIGDNIVYKLLLSTRKASGKIQPLTDLIHSYLVNSVLTKSYSTMGQADLAAKHEAQTVSDAEVIGQLLHSKLPPVL